MTTLKTMRDRYARFKQHRVAFHPGARSWYSIQAKDETAEVFIYDGIGMFGIEAESFIRDFEAIDAKSITLRINSPGGDVFDGAAIVNAIRQSKAKVTARVEGLAASMASVIALAADRVEMSENAFFMIHNPWSMVIGSSSDMRKEADLLDKVGDTLIDMYVRRSSLSEKEVRDAMDEETWYNAQEAKDVGFADEIIESSDAKASFDLSVFAHVPDGLESKADRNLGIKELEAALRDAGLSRKAAKAVLAEGYDGLLPQRDVGGGELDWQRDAAEGLLAAIKNVT